MWIVEALFNEGILNQKPNCVFKQLGGLHCPHEKLFLVLDAFPIKVADTFWNFCRRALDMYKFRVYFNLIFLLQTQGIRGLLRLKSFVQILYAEVSFVGGLISCVEVVFCTK